MTRFTQLGIVVVLASLPAAAACGKGSNPTAPVVVHANVAGAWSGRAVPAGSPSGFLGLAISTTLAQTGTTVVGTFTCGSVFCIGPTASLSATVNQRDFTAQLAFANGGACGTFKGTVAADGARIDGTYVCTGPEGSDQGTWWMTKQ